MAVLQRVSSLIYVAVLVLSAGCASTVSRGDRLDFVTRCQAPGVIRCFGFDSQTKTDPHIYPPWGQTQKRAMVVSDVTASGAGSLRFEIPSNSGSDTSGSFWLNFADDFSIQFGEGDEFYVQWRQRFAPEFINTAYAGGGGWKQIIVGEGDRPGVTANSCTQLEIVVTNSYHLGYPVMYHSCGEKDGDFDGLYSKGSGKYFPNEWMTFQIHVKIGTWYKNDGNYHQNSTVQLWVAREGKGAELVVDLSPELATLFGFKIPGTGTGYDLANNNPAARYGKLWLLPYNTHKDSSVSHPTAYTWYDDLIISTARIADPS
jgi:hypothetical protein